MRFIRRRNLKGTPNRSPKKLRQYDSPVVYDAPDEDTSALLKALETVSECEMPFSAEKDLSFKCCSIGNNCVYVESFRGDLNDVKDLIDFYLLNGNRNFAVYFSHSEVADFIPDGFVKDKDGDILYGYLYTQYRIQEYDQTNTLLSERNNFKLFLSSCSLNEIASTFGESYHCIGLQLDNDTDKAINDETVLLSSVWTANSNFIFTNYWFNDGVL